MPATPFPPGRVTSARTAATRRSGSPWCCGAWGGRRLPPRGLNHHAGRAESLARTAVLIRPTLSACAPTPARTASWKPAAIRTGARRYVVGHTQAPVLPPGLAPSVIAVLGLDRRPVAKPHFRKALATPNQTYTPPQMGQLYNFPANTDGSGQCVALIELGGGFRKTDLASYFAALGIATPTVTAVSVAGGKNRPSAAADSGSGDGESDGQPHVDFPASSPYTLACGGTTLTASTSAITGETVWNET